MSSVTARKKSIVSWLRLSKLFGPRVTDGDLELRVTYALYELLLPLPPSSRDRALRHVREILHEQAVALNAYEFQEE